MQIKDHKGNYIPIDEKNIFEAHKSLGHYKAPAGNRRTQFEETLKKAMKIADSISISPVGRSEAKILYETVYRPSVSGHRLSQ